MIQDPWSEEIIRQLRADVLIHCAQQFREALDVLGSFSCEEVSQMEHALESLEQEIERRGITQANGRSDIAQDSTSAEVSTSPAEQHASPRGLDERLKSLERTIEEMLPAGHYRRDNKTDDELEPATPSDKTTISSLNLQALERLSPLFKGISTSVVTVLNEEGRITYQSKYVEQLLGYKADELIGQNMESIVHPASLQTFNAQFTRLVKDKGQCAEWRLKLKTADDASCWLEGTVANLMHDPKANSIIVLWSKLVD